MKYLTRKKKSIKKYLLITMASLLIAVFLLWYFIHSSMPPMNGVLSLKNLKDQVSVKRDRYGVPHISATNRLDAFRALGFVVASERLFQMEIQRRVANGELAEILGPKLLITDKLFRSLSIRSSIQKMLENKIQNKMLNQEMWQEVQAFYDGVNQYQSTQKLPIEFSLLNIKPREFTALDGYAFIGLMSFSFGVATSQEPLMTELLNRFGRNLVNDLRNELTPYELQQTEKEKKLQHKNKKVVRNEIPSNLGAALAQIENGFGLFEGSNGWILSKERSASGYPVLANDPHIAYSNPGVWFEAHIKTPDFESYGHFLPLLPYPVLSHNRNYGWGLTMSLIDDMDLYREKLNKQNKTYYFIDRELPLNERSETIKIKDQAAVSIVVKSTHHGPLLDEVFDRPNEKSLALKWAFHHSENDPLLSLYQMGKAQNMEQFKAAVASGKAPGLNVLYADKKNIAWWIFGEISLKKESSSSDFILDGSSGKDEYVGTLNFADKPRLENPSSGIIVSANARPKGVPEAPPHLRGDWQPDDRYKTLEAILAQKTIWSVEEFKELQTLNLNLENKLLLAELLKSLNFENLWQKGRAENYLVILKEWNYISSADSIAPTLYYTWCRELVKLLLRDLSATELEAFAKLPNSWNFLKRVILNPDSAWWDKYNRQKSITDAFNNTIESLRQSLGEDYRNWAWGHLHKLELVHPIGRQKPFDKIFNIGPVSIGGASHEINNQKTGGFLDGFLVKNGPSTRRIIDFKRPEKAWGILPSGNSGHLLSPFYKDQLELFVNGKYREEWLDEKDIDENQTYFLRLTPVK